MKTSVKKIVMVRPKENVKKMMCGGKPTKVITR